VRPGSVPWQNLSPATCAAAADPDRHSREAEQGSSPYLDNLMADGLGHLPADALEPMRRWANH